LKIIELLDGINPLLEGLLTASLESIVGEGSTAGVLRGAKLPLAFDTAKNYSLSGLFLSSLPISSSIIAAASLRIY